MMPSPNRPSNLLVSVYVLLGLSLWATVPARAALIPRTPLPKRPYVLYPSDPSQMAIKFVDAMKARTQQGQLTAQDQAMLDEVTPVIAEHNLLFTKLIQLPYVKLTNLEKRAATYSGKAQPDLGGMMVVHFPAWADELTVANDLLALDAVEYVINELLTIRLHEDIPPTTPLLWGNQGYFGPDPGMDMDYSWSRASINGLFNTRAKGIKLTQVEAAWRLEHEDLVDQGVFVIREGEPFADQLAIWHGTSVLGIMAAGENAYGLAGLAPEATMQVSARTANEGYIVALTEAIDNSATGDVISTSFGVHEVGPLEVLESYYDLIVLAVDSGITVTQSAGNDYTDLDNSIEDHIVAWLLRRDSGAIIVGAGTADTLHQRLDFSNYGQRVNVHCWGEQVFTLACFDVEGAPPCLEFGGDPNQQYEDFGGTSAASPMIASACASLQGLRRDRLGNPMKPQTLRQLLIDTGIPQGGADPESEHIGPVPDLRAAIDDLLDDPSVPLPFFDDFPNTTPDPANWAVPHAVIDDLGDGEPSLPYSFHFAPTYFLESASMVTTDACTVGSEIQATLTFWYQDGGTATDPDGDLVVRYRDNLGSDP